MQRANDLVAQKKAAVSGNATADQRNTASQATRSTANDMMVNEKAAYDKLYAAVPENTPITFSNARQAALTVAKEYGENSANFPGISTAKNTIAKLWLTREKNPATTFGELKNDIAGINSLINEAEAAGQTGAARLYNMYKQGLVADREAGGAANDALKKANESFAQFQNRWRNGVAGKALDKNTLPSDTMGTYMGSPEGAQQFAQTVGQTPAGKKAAGDFLSSQVANSAGANPTKQSVLAAVNKNEAISTFPEVKAAEQAKALQIGAATTFQENQAATLKSLQDKAASAQKQAESSLPAQYANGSPDAAVSAVGKAFASDDPTRAVGELMKIAKQDRSGKAVEGLQNATREWLGRKLFNKTNAAAKNETTGITNADLPTSMARSADVINDSGTIFKNLRGVLPPEELANLQKNYQRLELSTRIRKAGAGQSATSMNEADKSAIDNLVKGYTNIDAFRTFKSAKTILQDLKTLAGSAVVNSRVNDMVNDIRMQAFLDPEKMQQLLLRPTAAKFQAHVLGAPGR
jgi:hypothetical protein